MQEDRSDLNKKPEEIDDKWYQEGYEKGLKFAYEEAEYEDIAAIARARGIPVKWDLFRAEILNQYLKTPGFNFKSYAAGFSRACIELYEKI